MGGHLNVIEDRRYGRWGKAKQVSSAFVDPQLGIGDFRRNMENLYVWKKREIQMCRNASKRLGLKPFCRREGKLIHNEMQSHCNCYLQTAWLGVKRRRHAYLPLSKWKAERKVHGPPGLPFFREISRWMCDVVVESKEDEIVSKDNKAACRTFHEVLSNSQ